jgi:predicted ester cyclase
MGAEQDANKAIVLRNYEEIWNQGRLEVAEELVDPSFHDHPPTRFFDVGRTGPDSLQEAVRHFREAFADFHDMKQLVLAEDDRVAYLGTISGTQDGELFGFPPAGEGNTMRVRGINFFRLADGMIVERWGQFDVLTMMMQLGLAPSPGGPPGLGEDPEVMPLGEASAEDRERNKEVYRRMVEEVVNQGNFDVVDEIFDPAYHDHSAPPGVPGGLAGVKAIFGMFRTAFPDVKFTIQSLVAEGDVVASLVEGTGTQTGPFMGIPPSNLPAKWRSVGFFRVTDKGQIVEHTGIPDMLGLLIQIGVIPPPPNVESAKPHD